MTAVYAGSMRISYGVIIVTLAFAASCLMTFSLALSGKEKASVRVRQIVSLIMYAGFAGLLAAFFGRCIYWYSHFESYDGLSGALSGFEGCYHEAGIILGFFIASVMSSFFVGKGFAGKMMSASACGCMLFMTLVSLVSMFNDSDRGKAVITDPYYQRLPYSYITNVAGGGTEYRNAVFFWKFIVLAVVTLISFILFVLEKTALLTYVCYFSSMALLDSARYDASFLRSNGFVSLMQIVAGVFLLVTMIACLIRSVKKRGFHIFQVLLVLLFLAGIGMVGYMEYYVQRHGDLYVFCYLVMSCACLAMTVSVWALYASVKARRTEDDAEDGDESSDDSDDDSAEDEVSDDADEGTDDDTDEDTDGSDILDDSEDITAYVNEKK